MSMESQDETGHDFRKKLLRPGNNCHHCGESLWGSNLVCSICKFVSHAHCSEGVVTACSRTAISEIARPVAHRWGPVQKFKRKFCNVCRKRMDDRCGQRCQVCKFYAHKACLANSLPNCKRSAEYDTFVTPDESSQTRHQWLEGNIRASERCDVCAQPCSADCLTGHRCLWCHRVVHSACRRSASVHCDVGPVRNLILPAYCVYRPDIAQHLVSTAATLSASDTIDEPELGSHSDQLLGLHLNDAEGDDISIAESLSPDSISTSTPTVTVKVYDSSLDTYKKILIPSDADSNELLVAAQVEFHIPPEEHSMFCLALETGPQSYEPMDKLVCELGAGDKLVFRSTELHMSSIRVHHSINHQGTDHRVLSISPLTTADEVVDRAIEEFRLIVSDEQRRHYVLVEMNMNDGLSERILDQMEKPYKVLHDHAKISVQQLQMVRLYLRNVRMDLPATFYVGNLPQTWEEERLVSSLRQVLGPGISDNTTFGPAFPQHGCIFIHVHNEDSARLASRLLQTSILVESKRPKVHLVPTLRDEVIPEDCTPLLTFINERSGGGQGADLYTQMIRLLNPNQVFNLSQGGPLPGLFAFRRMGRFKILVAGGDGTVGWVLSMIDAMKELWANHGAPVAVIPLGTGNDLARVLRWGGGYSGESAPAILEMIEESLVVPLDRWNVSFELMGTVVQPDAGTAEAAPEKPPQAFVMNNYLGVGVEADIALKFHLAREENPERFSSRLHNKGVYLKMSIAKMMQRGAGGGSSSSAGGGGSGGGGGAAYTCSDLSKIMVLEVDGERVKLPSGTAGVIFLNIRSWMSGCDGWGAERDDKFRPPSMNDGLMEVIGVQGVMHLGQIQGGMRAGVRLAQGSSFAFRLSCPTPIEIDGEPFMQPASRCRITQGNTAQMMRRHKRLHGSFPSVSLPPVSAS